MKKALLKVETAVSLPFFFLSWMVCSMYYAVRAGATIAKAEQADKELVLAQMFPDKLVKEDAQTTHQQDAIQPDLVRPLRLRWQQRGGFWRNHTRRVRGVENDVREHSAQDIQ